MGYTATPYNPFLPVWEVVPIGAVAVAPAVTTAFQHAVSREMLGLSMFGQVRDNTGGDTFRYSIQFPKGSGPSEAFNVPTDMRVLALPGQSRGRAEYPFAIERGDTITGNATVSAGGVAVVADLVIAGLSIDPQQQYLRALHGWRAWRALLRGIDQVPIFDPATGAVKGRVGTVETLVELFTRPGSRSRLKPVRRPTTRVPRWHTWRPTNVPFADGSTTVLAPFTFNRWGLVIRILFQWELGAPDRSLLSLQLDDISLMNLVTTPTPRVDPALFLATEYSDQRMELPFPFAVSEVTRWSGTYEIPAGGAGTEGLIEVVTPYFEGPPEEAIPALADYLQVYSGLSDPETIDRLAAQMILPADRSDVLGLESVPRIDREVRA